MLARIVPRLAGFRPALTPDPFEMLVGAITAQQVSLFSALAIRNRFVERFGVRAGEAWSFPARDDGRGGERGGALLARLLAAEGRVRRRARALRPRPRRARGAARRRGARAARRAARPRGVDGRVVPRAPPRAPERMAGRRPRAAEGGCPSGGRCVRAYAFIRSRTCPRTTSCSPTASRDPHSDHRRSPARPRALA